MTAMASARGRGVAVVVVLLIVLSGCNALPGSSAGGGAATPPEGMSSPVPVPTDEPTPTPGPADVPGLSGTGIENGSTLLAAHADRLRNRSFTIQYNSTFVFENGTVAGRSNGTFRVGSGSRLFSRYQGSDSLDTANDAVRLMRIERWFDEKRSFRASIYANGTRRYFQVPSDRRVNRSELVSAYVSPITNLDANRSRVVNRVRRANTTLFRIEGRTASEFGNNRTISALVDARGHVHESNLTFTFGTNLTQRITVRYTDVGTTTVERPAWYDEALGNATTPRPRFPVEEPTDTPTPSAESLPVPGVSEAGVESGQALLDAHAASFEDTSVTIRSASTFLAENGTVVGTTNETTRLGNESRMFNRREFNRSIDSSGGERFFVGTEFWSAGNRSFSVLRYANGSMEYDRLPPEGSVERGTWLRSSLARVAELDTGHSRVVARIERADTTLYQIAGQVSGPVRSNATVSLLVDAEGRIHEFRATGIRAAGNRTQRTTTRYTDIGNTTVERPDWYAEAVENVTPLGLTQEAVTDPAALASAYADVLGATSFTYRSSTIERGANGQVITERTRNGQFGSREHHYYATVATARPETMRPETMRPGNGTNASSHREVWTDGGRVLVATATANGTQYDVLRRLDIPSVDRPNRSAALLFDPIMEGELRALLSSMNLSVAETDEPGTYLVNGTLADRSAFPVSGLSLASVRDASLRAVVDSSGLVRRYQLSYTGTNRTGATIRGRRTIQYTEIGATVVDRPAWYEDAAEAVSSTSD